MFHGGRLQSHPNKGGYLSQNRKRKGEGREEFFFVHQQKVKIWIENKFAGEKDFQVGDLILEWDKPHKEKGNHTKFQHLCLSPYLVVKKLGLGMYRIQNLD
jgi:hypothetical protein